MRENFGLIPIDSSRPSALVGSSPCCKDAFPQALENDVSGARLTPLEDSLPAPDRHERTPAHRTTMAHVPSSSPARIEERENTSAASLSFEGSTFVPAVPREVRGWCPTVLLAVLSSGA